MLRTLNRPAAIALGLLGSLAAPAIADGPVQTDYDFEFYFFTDSGAIVSGSLAYGIADTIVTTDLGPLASGLEFLPNGTLLAIGGYGPGAAWVVSVDIEAGTYDVLISQNDLTPFVPGLYLFMGIAAAPDNTFYATAWLLDGDNIVSDLIHLDTDGSYISNVRIKNADGSDAFWSSHAMTVRDDGKLLAGNSNGPTSPNPNTGKIAVIDPDSGVLNIIADIPDGSVRFRGFTTLGSTLFANLGEYGTEVYLVDPYTAEFTFVASIAGMPGTGFGFATQPDPCPADMTYDQLISTDDINTFADAFLSGSTAADLDYDRTRTVDDVDIFFDSFLSGCD